MKHLITFTVLSFLSIPAFSQMRKLPADTTIVTQHETTIKGERVPYRATCGTQPVWGEDGRAIASLFYTFYERTDITNQAERPLVISFNGGPGSASVWMHIAYTGPVVLEIDDEGYPIQPYGIRDNPYSLLDVADIVYVNPVNTAYSRILDPEVDKKTFFGVNQDIKYLADWLNNFVTRKNRWRSPKYLIGESYGTTRVSGLALELQNAQWMYLNGVILVSPTGLGIERDGPVEAANRIPYFSAAAWYHKALPKNLQSQDLDDVLALSEDFAINEALPALAKGGFLDIDTKNKIAEGITRFSGLSMETVLQNNLKVPISYFWKDLQRKSTGFTLGRLDSRYLGIDREDAGTRPDYSAELTSWLHSFTPAINYYIRNHLKFETDIKYNMFGSVRPWDRNGDRTGENLRQAMAQNPYLKVLIQSGYYDGATTYFNAKYSMWNIDPSGKMSDRLDFKGYRSGHMMYLRREDLESANEHLREFIKSSLPGKGVPAKY